MATTTHRIVCADFTQEVTSLRAAQGHLSDVEAAGKCRQPHTIEVRVGGEWVALHIARAREILAAPMATVIDTPDGPLCKAHGGWSKEAGERADAVADSTTDPAAWLAAIGPHELATLTADGKGIRDGWCQCAAQTQADAWVRYERWTREGRAGHGYACPNCRQVTQTG